MYVKQFESKNTSYGHQPVKENSVYNNQQK